MILIQMVLGLKSRAKLQVEILALRHQIEILKRTAPKRARLTLEAEAGHHPTYTISISELT